jgi:phytanoyl-CoA hydroxylase
VSAETRVFFEPKIPLHDPDLYAFERQDDGVAAAEADLAASLERYRDDGFLMVRGLLPESDVLVARAELEAMARADPPGCAMIWYEGALRDHMAQPDLMALVERLVGAVPALFQDMALVKPAQGREKPWHQDHAFFNVALDTPIVGVWIPMGEVTPENGCMHLLAGGHKAGARIHFKRRDWQICDTDVPARGRVAVPMRVGDVLLFDGKLPHGTPINRTDDFRWAVQYHYRPADAVQTDDAVRLAAFGSEGRNITC